MSFRVKIGSAQVNVGANKCMYTNTSMYIHIILYMQIL